MLHARVGQLTWTFRRRRSSRRAAFHALAAGVAVVMLVTPFWTQAQTATPAVPGALVDIGDRSLFLSCSGTGSPTVILESGLNDTAAVWSAVQGEVTRTTRVCSYDRANIPGGASNSSDPTASTPRLRSAAELVADLHALLGAAAVPGPYVLVGHSVGGLLVRLYAATYPHDVAGLVLVDATHEDNWARLEDEIGPELWPQAVEQFTQAVAGGFLEPLDLEETAAEVRDAREEQPLPSIPLIVLTHTQPPDAATLLPGLSVEVSERLWGEQQADLTTLLPNSQQILAGESGHHIQLDQPDLVIDAIAEVIEIVAGLSTEATPGAGTPTMMQTTLPATVASTPVGEALAWILTLLNEEGASLTPDEMTARFAPAFLEAVPPEIMVGLTQQIAAGGPYTLEGFTRPSTANQVNALLIGQSSMPLVVPLSVEAAAPHRITGVNFAPVPPPPGVQLHAVSTDEAPLAEGEVRATETGRLDGLFDVNGHQIYLSCAGTGSPSVVLESGHNDPAAPWFAIERAVAPFTRVCTYDRPNTAGSASDPVPTPVTVQDAVDDLHALLAAANVPGPYVLVGHSLGGLINRLYASTYPDEVVGLVLVDASHEEQDARLEALVSPGLWQAYQEMMANVLNIERLDFATSFAQVREARATAPFRPMPLVVVSAGAAEDPSTIPTFFPPGWPVEVMPQLHRELQADLVSLVPNGRQVIAERSGHYVHQGEPELVLEAIRNVVDAVRNPETWDAPAPGTPTPTSASEPVASFDSLLESGVEGGLTGVALAVDKDGEVLFDGATGLANDETQTPLSPTDRFRIYSITKTFTAVLVLQLVDEGVLTLEDTVSQWLDDPVVTRIPNVDRITIRQLLTHTSGVYDYYNGADSSFVDDAITGEGADWSKVWTAHEVLAYVDGTRHAADFDPGQGVNYSDTGYILLGLIVEQASGQTFTEQLHARILDPLGLADTFFAAAEPVPGGTVEGYHRLGDELINVSGINLSWAWTQGGMVSTTEDLTRFADALFSGDLIGPASIEAMLTFLPPDEQGREWGMGVARVQTPMGGLIGMNGSGPGFVARMFRLPTGATVVLLANTNLEDDTVNAIFEQAVHIALGSVTATAFSVTAGRYPEETL